MSRSSRRSAKGSFPILKWVLITGGTFLVLLVVGLLFAKSMFNNWLRGEAFREWIAARLSGALHAEVQLDPLEWSGSEVYTKRFNARGREAAGFSELKVEGVRAKPRGIVDRAVQVPEVSISRLDLRFSPKRTQKRVPSRSERYLPAEVAPRAESKVPAWMQDYLPNRVELNEIEIASVRVNVEKEEGSVFLLNGMRGTIYPDFRTELWEIRGEGGTIAVPNQPEARVKDLALRWKGSEIFVDRCALAIFKEGYVEGQGEVHLGEGGAFDLNWDFSSIDVDELVAPEWQERLTGNVHGSVHVTGAPGDLSYEGRIHLTEGVIESLSILSQIARYTRSERFERLVLNETTANYRHHGDRVELRDLVIQSDGLLRIEGQVDLVGDALAGELQVGVTPGTMRWIPGAERLVFVEDRNGFLWAPMRLSGTTANPKEDLSGRLIAAAGETMIKDLPAGILEGAKGLLDPSRETPSSGDVIDQGKKMLDLLTPFLKAP